MDLNIAIWINNLGKWTWIDPISMIISRSPLLVWLFIIIGLFLFIKYPQKRLQLLITIAVWSILFLLVNDLIFKHILVDISGIRLRPYIANQELINPIGARLTDSSFPSSHMASTLMILTILVRFIPWSRSIALIITLLMAFSRIHNGMHYTTDVIAWTILWVCYGYWGLFASKKIEKYILKINKN